MKNTSPSIRIKVGLLTATASGRHAIFALVIIVVVLMLGGALQTAVL